MTHLVKMLNFDSKKMLMKDILLACDYLDMTDLLKRNDFSYLEHIVYDINKHRSFLGNVEIYTKVYRNGHLEDQTMIRLSDVSGSQFIHILHEIS